MNRMKHIIASCVVAATLLSILAPPALWLVVGPILRKEMAGKGRQ